MKTSAKVLTIILSIFLVVLTVPTVSAANDISPIEDVELNSILLDRYDENNDGVLTIEECDKVRVLSVSYSNVHSLKGMNTLFSNLIEIDISGTLVENLNGLEGMNLKYFYATNCKNLVNIDPLKDMINLKVIQCSNCNLAELPNLKECANLQFDWNSPVAFTTGFDENKLTYDQLFNNMPDHIINMEGDVITYWSKLQKHVIEPTQPSPEEPTVVPEEPTAAPEEPTVVPEEPTTAPEEPTVVPEEPTVAPEEPTAAPEEPTVAPEEPTVVPEEPTVSPEEPTVTPEEPTVTPEEPTVTPEEPTVTPEEPTVTPEEPTATPEEPTVTPEEPTDPTTPTQAPTVAPTPISPTPSSNSTTTTTTGGKVAAPVVNTGEEAMKSILVAILLAATTAVLATSKKKRYY